MFAVVIACISPVKCKFISSIGATCAFPPPVAPPFIPNTGPNEGSLNANIDFFPIFASPSAIAIDIVVFPSPKGVGFIAVTNTNFPFFLFSKFFIISFDILALYLPYVSKYISGIPVLCAITLIFSKFASLAISISVIIFPP